jgi:hypothetical protein
MLEDLLAGLQRMLLVSEDCIISSSLDRPEHCNNNFHEDGLMNLGSE